MSIDLDDLHMESILYPWLDSDCMADETTDETFCDDFDEECDDEYIDEHESYDSFLNDFPFLACPFLLTLNESS
jgi:hypothetical protein